MGAEGGAISGRGGTILWSDCIFTDRPCATATWPPSICRAMRKSASCGYWHTSSSRWYPSTHNARTSTFDSSQFPPVSKASLISKRLWSGYSSRRYFGSCRSARTRRLRKLICYLNILHNSMAKTVAPAIRSAAHVPRY